MGITLLWDDFKENIYTISLSYTSKNQINKTSFQFTLFSYFVRLCYFSSYTKLRLLSILTKLKDCRVSKANLLRITCQLRPMSFTWTSRPNPRFSINQLEQPYHVSDKSGRRAIFLWPLTKPILSVNIFISDTGNFAAFSRGQPPVGNGPKGGRGRLKLPDADRTGS